MIGGQKDAFAYIEKVLIWIMTAAYPSISPGFASTSSTVSVIKNLTIAVVLAAAVGRIPSLAHRETTTCSRDS